MAKRQLMLEKSAQQRARIRESLACDGHGENVMQTHCQRLKGRTLGITCFEAALSSE
jgi:formylmethanofuran dehydrogenase subunit E